MPDERACAWCKTVKPLTEFAPKVTNRSGFSGVCRSCEKGSPPPGLTDKEVQRMCREKRRFKSLNSAIRAALGHSRGHGQRVRPYQCPVCKKWHLTTKVTSRYQTLYKPTH